MVFEVDPLLAATVHIALIIIGAVFILKLSKDKTKKVSTLRLFIQIAAVFGIFMGLVIGPFGTARMLPLGISPREHLVTTNIFGIALPDGLSVPVLGCYYANGRTVTCPIWQMQAYIFPLWSTGRGYNVVYDTPGIERLAIVFVSVIGLSLVLGRFFCGWICPFGLYMDLMIRIRKTFKKPYRLLSQKTNKALRQLSYITIAVFLILSVIFASQYLFGTQLVPGTDITRRNISEGGFVTNYLQAPFCLVCPMRPLCVIVEMGTGLIKPSYVFQIIAGPLGTLGYYVTSINVTILILVTAAALIFRRFWCRICPLGGLIALFSTFYPFKKVALTRIHKNEGNCKRCGVCKRTCPTQVTEVYDKKGGDVTVSGCILCLRCVEMCPYEGALEVKVAKKSIWKSRNWLKT